MQIGENSMRQTITFFLLVLFFAPIQAKKETQFRDSVLNVLDEAIENNSFYLEKKEKQIAEIKQLLAMPNITLEQVYDINHRLLQEYKSYISDSAVVYIKKNIEIAQQLNHKEWLYGSKIDLASLYSTTLMFVEASDILRSIPGEELSPRLHRLYFDAYRTFLNHYSHDSESYKTLYHYYTDSLYNTVAKDSKAYFLMTVEKLITDNKPQEARKMLLPELAKSPKEDGWRAIIAYNIGETYRAENNYEMQQAYYGISAISDIKNAIKENASFLSLSIACYEEGDINQAYKYIQQSVKDANFSNSRLRTMESSQIFPVIESAYQQELKTQKNRLILLVIFVVLLLFILIGGMLYIYKQMQKLAKARESLHLNNQQLFELNQDLQDTNQQMIQINKELSESNLLKEEYLARYMDQCSIYLDKMDKYRRNLNKIASTNKVDDLYKALKSQQFMEDELKEFYMNFDSSFLQLFPNFVESFNNLLLEEEKITPKQKELLNTELRIFALIRLGITDSAKIANFLRYPVNTIYNYRTKVRNKAAGRREEFEENVMKIGMI